MLVTFFELACCLCGTYTHFEEVCYDGLTCIHPHVGVWRLLFYILFTLTLPTHTRESRCREIRQGDVSARFDPLPKHSTTDRWTVTLPPNLASFKPLGQLDQTSYGELPYLELPSRTPHLENV